MSNKEEPPKKKVKTDPKKKTPEKKDVKEKKVEEVKPEKEEEKEDIEEPKVEKKFEFNEKSSYENFQFNSNKRKKMEGMNNSVNFDFGSPLSHMKGKLMLFGLARCKNSKEKGKKKDIVNFVMLEGIDLTGSSDIFGQEKREYFFLRDPKIVEYAKKAFREKKIINVTYKTIGSNASRMISVNSQSLKYAYKVQSLYEGLD